MSQTPTGTVAGYFESHADAASAVNALQAAGFTNAHLGVAYRAGAADSKSAAFSAGEKAGGVWNKVKNFFEGGDSTEATRSESAGNYAYGSSDFDQSLSGLSVSQDRSRYLAHRFRKGKDGAVVTVTAPGREAEAETILLEYDADLGAQAESYEYPEDEDNTEYQGQQNIQLLGEVLRVHKDRVGLGEVRLRKEVITETQTVQVPVTREELVIERYAVAGTESASGTIGESSEIRIPLSEERASVDKATVVREKVSVGKREVENVRDLTSDVRHEELVVEDETKKSKDGKVA
jgi:uncharacterized protein (TIGR02271 family)